MGLQTGPLGRGAVDGGVPRSQGFWFGAADRPLAGWWTPPSRSSRDGVLIVPPLGYEYWSTHRSLRSLAESLACNGWHVVRFDWDGTGDSSGDAEDTGRVAAWRACLAAAVTTMRDAGLDRIVLVGVRLGATLGMLDAASLGISEIIACVPVVSGRRFTRELKLLGNADPQHPDTVVYAGLVVDHETAADLAAIDLVKDPPPAVPRTLLVTRPEAQLGRLAERLESSGRALHVRECANLCAMLDCPAEEATVPGDFIQIVVEWLRPARPAPRAACAPTCVASRMTCAGGSVDERFIQIGELSAIETRPAEAADPRTVIAFLNSGSEPHVGPARAWVDYARTLGVRGHACVRVDFSGWGESPDRGHAPGRPYDPHCVAETMELVAELRRRYARVVVAGLCAGAWVALRAAQHAKIDGVFALNPQLYWQPGDPVEALIADTRRRRTRARRLVALGARMKWWSLLDSLGIRPMASRWLTTLRKRRVRVMFSFAEDDDGLTFLRHRCGRRIARELRHGYLAVEEVAEIDHQMYRVWRRSAIRAQLEKFVNAIGPPPPADAC